MLQLRKHSLIALAKILRFVLIQTIAYLLLLELPLPHVASHIHAHAVLLESLRM
jgi:hypothetical protein